MSKRHVEDILYDEFIKNNKCDKIKIKLGNNREKVSFDELSNSYYSRRIKYLEFISVHFIPG